MTTVSTTSRDNVLPPPSERFTVLGWLLKNLFNTWYNAVLTLIALGITFLFFRGLLTWAFTSARWAVVPANMRLFLVGQYPSAIEGQRDFIWRLGMSLYLLAGVIGLTWGVWVKKREPIGWVLFGAPIVIAAIPLVFSLFPQDISTPAEGFRTALGVLALDAIALVAWGIGKWRGERLKRMTTILWILYFPVTILLINGNFFGPAYPVDDESALSSLSLLFIKIPTRFWGGLLLSLILSVVGIVFSFPIGVTLALGRQSNLPVMRNFSILYIEFIRGVPLISLLFMGQVMLNLFLPSNITFDRVVRAMIPITLFAAAYLAENVRGGLQSIPKGQYEAAHAMGLSGFQTMTFIVLPQALRAVIPPMVGQFIGLFKDTTLVAIVGLLDLLGIARGVTSNPDYIGTQREVFIFISLFYFVFSYALSYTSRRLETSLGVGER